VPRVAPEQRLLAVRSAAGDIEKELSVQPLRDPQVEDLRQRSAAAIAARDYKSAADALNQALLIVAEDPGILQERAEVALLQSEFERAETLAQRAYASGARVGPLCRRHWATIEQSRLARGLTDDAASAAHADRRLHPGRLRKNVAMSRLAQASREALSEGGALAGQLHNFVPRQAQQRLSTAIAEAFEGREVLLAEAGTGTGKTFAYLVPALLSGMKTIISTGTRALQDQLYHRDLPRVRDALGTGLKSALLKGRANYLCRYRLQQAKGEPRSRLPRASRVSQFQRVVAWSGRTRFGDMAELDGLPEDSRCCRW
jgi:hypothetical protein